MNKTTKITVKIITTMFFMGYFPIAPGTFTSIIFSVLRFFIKSPPGYYVITVVILVLGFTLTGFSAKEIFKKNDPKEIVIDEASGILITFLWIPSSSSFLFLTIGLVIFRILDIFKPFPINKIEKLKGSMGIMLDDLFSGLVTNGILHVLMLSLIP